MEKEAQIEIPKKEAGGRNLAARLDGYSITCITEKHYLQCN